MKKVNWECEFCKNSFKTKSLLEKHSKNSGCSKLFYKKYRILVLFPWNNSSGKVGKCIDCGIEIPFKGTRCRRCSNIEKWNDKEVTKKRIGNLKKNHWLKKLGNIHPCKGKTYEEIHGVEKGTKLRQLISRIVKEKQSTDIRKRMKEWQASYMSSRNLSPSKPQVETWKLVSKICPYVYLNYPVNHLKNIYCIDIAIPKLGIAIEYDGSYWHQDKEKDLKRQQELEAEGWKFIRFIDKVPTKEEILENIQRIIT